jgi:hypothetical protein
MCNDTLTGPPCIAVTMLKCVCVFVCVYVCVCVCMYICMYICVCLCLYVCMCMCVMYVSVVCMYSDQIRICNASVEKVIYKNSDSKRISLK